MRAGLGSLLRTAAVAVVVIVAAVEAGKTVLISNFKNRAKDYPYDAHDGPVRQWKAGGYYYRYAMSCELRF